MWLYNATEKSVIRILEMNWDNFAQKNRYLGFQKKKVFLVSQISAKSITSQAQLQSIIWSALVRSPSLAKS